MDPNDGHTEQKECQISRIVYPFLGYLLLMIKTTQKKKSNLSLFSPSFGIPLPVNLGRCIKRPGARFTFTLRTYDLFERGRVPG